MSSTLSMDIDSSECVTPFSFAMCNLGMCANVPDQLINKLANQIS